MNGARKSTILLQSLDRTLLAQVLALLPANQVEFATRLRTSIECPTSAELHSVLVEFRNQHDAQASEFKLKFQAPPGQATAFEPPPEIPAAETQPSLAAVPVQPVAKPTAPSQQAPVTD